MDRRRSLTRSRSRSASRSRRRRSAVARRPATPFFPRDEKPRSRSRSRSLVREPARPISYRVSSRPDDPDVIRSESQLLGGGAARPEDDYPFERFTSPHRRRRSAIASAVAERKVKATAEVDVDEEDILEVSELLDDIDVDIYAITNRMARASSPSGIDTEVEELKDLIRARRRATEFQQRQLEEAKSGFRKEVDVPIETIQWQYCRISDEKLTKLMKMIRTGVAWSYDDSIGQTLELIPYRGDTIGIDANNQIIWPRSRPKRGSMRSELTNNCRELSYALLGSPTINIRPDIERYRITGIFGMGVNGFVMEVTEWDTDNRFAVKGIVIARAVEDEGIFKMNRTRYENYMHGIMYNLGIATRFYDYHVVNTRLVPRYRLDTDDDTRDIVTETEPIQVGLIRMGTILDTVANWLDSGFRLHLIELKERRLSDPTVPDPRPYGETVLKELAHAIHDLIQYMDDNHVVHGDLHFENLAFAHSSTVKEDVKNVPYSVANGYGYFPGRLVIIDFGWATYTNVDEKGHDYSEPFIDWLYILPYAKHKEEKSAGKADSWIWKTLTRQLLDRYANWTMERGNIDRWPLIDDEFTSVLHDWTSKELLRLRKHMMQVHKRFHRTLLNRYLGKSV